ncbi:MAG: glycosyltransferase family 4 protein, partial [Gemmatimonadaceae bacterium]
LERVELAKAASPRRPRSRMSPPPPTMGGVSILPGRFDGSARLANRVPMWPDPLRPSKVHRARAPHRAPLADHRIVFAATSGRISGVDIFAVHLVRALVSRGFDAEILVTRPDEPVPDPLPFPGDVPVRRLSVTPRTSWRARWKGLADDLERDGAPVLYVPNYDWRHSGISPSLASTVKIVGIVHSDDPQHYEHALRLGDAWNGIVAVSDAIAREVQALAPRFSQRLETIPYGVPVPSAAAPRTRRPGDPLRIVYAGRLARYQKRALDVVGVADALAARGIPFELVVAGGGPEQGDFLAAAARHLVGGRLRFVGGIPNDMVQELLSRADAFLLPSAFEGLPVALLEAMACGAVPVVSDIRSGVRQVVRHAESGFLVAPGDVHGFADRLAELALDPDRTTRMSVAAHAAVRDGPFTVDAMCDHYLDFFDRVASSPFARPDAPPRHPPDIAGLRAWLPPELPTPAQVSARLRQLARRALGGG